MTEEILIKNPDDIPIEVLYGNSTVQQLLSKMENQDLEKDVKIPYIIKDKVLMSPGVWNGIHYSNDTIQDAFLKTQWDQKEIRSLFLDHVDDSSKEWVGEVKNVRINGEDLIGNLVIVDKPTAMKLAYGAKMGVSPKVHGKEDGGCMLSFLFDNFSVVINPAVKTAYINNRQKEVSKMSEEEEKKKDAPKEEEKKEEVNEEATKEESEEAPVESSEENQKKKKYPYPEEEKTNAELEQMAEEELAKRGQVAGIAKKAKAIRKEGESWASAVKRAAKMSEEEPTVAKEEKLLSAITDLAKEIRDLKNTKVEMAAAVIKHPAKGVPTQHGQKPTGKPAGKFIDQVHTAELSELKEKLATVERKLNEPDKQTVRSEELSFVAGDGSSADEGMLNFIKSQISGLGGV